MIKTEISHGQLHGFSAGEQPKASAVNTRSSISPLGIARQMLGQSFNSLVILPVFALAALVGWLDCATGEISEVSVDILYLIPISLCTWISGRNWGLLAAVACTVASITADIANPYKSAEALRASQHSPFTYVSAAMLLILFVAVVLLLHSQKRFQVNLAAQVAARTEELTQVNSELKATQARLVEAAKLETVAHLAAGVAHEVKNPLMTIMMVTDFLSQVVPAAEADAPEMLRHMREAIARANRVISELPALSRPAELSLSPENFHAVIDDALELIKLAVNQKHIRLVRDLPAPSPVVRVDRNKFTQVLINLLMNSVQAMPDSGTLLVRTHREGNAKIVLRIEDTGPGISPANLAKLFEPFFTTKAPGQGTGLGLSVSRQIVGQHGGSLSLGNREEGGACAVIELNINPDR
jgi:signal transduction histidine kinase